MIEQKIGIIHPGAMGISVAASIQNAGYPVYWASEGRSQATQTRAAGHHLHDTGTLQRLCDTVEVIISVCPPHAAEDVAARVIDSGFRGLYLDANAIAPDRAARIGAMVMESGGKFVDGGIIGGPAWEPGRTWLYLSGEHAVDIAALFVNGPMETGIIGRAVGEASALKMCFAAYTKGTSALLSAILAAADHYGVRSSLENQWSRGGSSFAEDTQQRVRRVTAKAWRFTGEMAEIAHTFETAGLPGGFHKAAEEIYQRMAHFKDAEEIPPLDAVLAALSGERNAR